ncbi:MAG: TldD/PmbA family protein [Clostridia bacterium]|nr:TldD/PmbA family protein [Clostridia bacterium]
MKTMTYEQFTERLFAEAAKAGISPAEVYYAERDSIKVSTHKQALETFAVASTAGLSFRGMAGGRMGYASTEALDEDAIAMLVRAVAESAALVEDEDVQEIFAGSPAYASVETYAPELDALPAAAHIDAAVALERDGLSRDPLVTETDYNQTAYLKSRISLRNSFGLSLSHQDNLRYHFLSVVARRDGRAADGGAFGIGRGTALDMDRELAKAVDYAVRMLDAAPIPSGKMPAVFRKDAMADLLECFSGAFSAEAAQKGLSLLKGREGEAIAADCVTLIDDPLMPGGFASCPFDAESVAAYKKEVIGKGTLHTLLHNLKTARVDGVRSTGNAAKLSYSAPVRVAPTNFYFAPGAGPLEALLRRMGDGLLITQLEGLHAGANGVSGDFSLSAKGFQISGGEIGRAVEQITVAGNFYTLLQDVLAVGSDLFFSPGGGAGSPSVWVREISVAGK